MDGRSTHNPVFQNKPRVKSKREAVDDNAGQKVHLECHPYCIITFHSCLRCIIRSSRYYLSMSLIKMGWEKKNNDFNTSRARNKQRGGWEFTMCWQQGKLLEEFVSLGLDVADKNEKLLTWGVCGGGIENDSVCDQQYSLKKSFSNVGSSKCQMSQEKVSNSSVSESGPPFPKWLFDLLPSVQPQP